MYRLNGSPGVRTVFLDRDGVLNRKAPEGAYISRLAEVEWLPGVFEALRLLHKARLPVYVVTNQRGVALGLYNTADVERLHHQMQEAFQQEGAAVGGMYYCPHDKAGCACRKPLTGLFEQAREQHLEIEWQTSVMIGDSLSDIEAGRHLGMRTVFLEGEPERRKPGAEDAAALAEATCDSLLSAVRLLLDSPA